MTGRLRTGFTLVELLVVVAIIVILAGTFIVASGLFKRPGQARNAVAVTKVAQLETLLAQFRLDTDRYPAEDEGLLALVEAPPGLEEQWTGPYCKERDILDPWGSEYIYEFPGTHNTDSFDLYTLGADGVEGGEGENEDVVNW